MIVASRDGWQVECACDCLGTHHYSLATTGGGVLIVGWWLSAVRVQRGVQGEAWWSTFFSL